MSCFLVGIIEYKLSGSSSNDKNFREFDNFLYKIKKIAINQELEVLIGWNIPTAAFDNIKESIPHCIKNKKNIVRFMITRSPMDNTSDNIFSNWEYEASKEDYVFGTERVFRNLENFFDETIKLTETESIWVRYQSIFNNDLNHIESWSDLETKIYKQYSNDNNFEISDFEIYKDKDKGTVLPEMIPSTEETDF